jgi:hypothetical protein
VENRDGQKKVEDWAARMQRRGRRETYNLKILTRRLTEQGLQLDNDLTNVCIGGHGTWYDMRLLGAASYNYELLQVVHVVSVVPRKGHWDLADLTEQIRGT